MKRTIVRSAALLTRLGDNLSGARGETARRRHISALRVFEMRTKAVEDDRHRKTLIEIAQQSYEIREAGCEPMVFNGPFGPIVMPVPKQVFAAPDAEGEVAITALPPDRSAGAN